VGEKLDALKGSQEGWKGTGEGDERSEEEGEVSSRSSGAEARGQSGRLTYVLLKGSGDDRDGHGESF
jgi:hypothetical protein